VALDLFCGAGGASFGLYEAGYDVVGVDIAPQPHYPALHKADYARHFTFVRADAMDYPLDGADLIWASPICKRFSAATRTSQTMDNWPDQIPNMRRRLVASGKPYVIENVTTAPLLNPMLLCGAMFEGLRTYRHRLFETSHLILAPLHRRHMHPITTMGRPPQPGDFINPVGHFSGVPYGRAALGIPWMTQLELAQAIPPAYARYIGKHYMEAIL
jgi:DNA (cytosine-5)-methyltransferase 1